jgi:hypothetical protein
MGQGTTRVAEDNAASGRVRALGHEITDVRRRLDALVVELDRRRHNVTDWRWHLRRHAGTIALGGLVVAVAVTAPVMLARARARRRRGKALERIADASARLAPTTAAAGLGARTAVAVATAVAEVLATGFLRAIVKQRAR